MRRLWILGGVLGLSLLGCGPSKFVGFYEGRQPQPNAPEPLGPMVAVIKLDLKPAGQFMFTRMSMPWEGEWQERDGKIYMKIDSALGKPSMPGSDLTDKEIVLVPQPDGSLKLEDPYVAPDEVVLLKKVAKGGAGKPGS